MKIYKVYAKCVRTAYPITEITLEEAKELIADTVSEMINNGDIDIVLEDEDDDVEFSEKLGELIGKAEEFLKENEFFWCGDFSIEYSDDYPSRGNYHGYTDFQ